AAGAAALIKSVMALKHRQLPPSLGFEKPNPQIDFENSPFRVNDRLRDWTGSEPLRCGVTALGAGGTNVHVILEEAPAPLPGEGGRAAKLLVVSAHAEPAVDEWCDKLAATLEQDSSVDLNDAAYTLALGRRELPHRRVFVVRDHADAIAQLRARDAKKSPAQHVSERPNFVAFMFPGGGAQYPRMGADLYEHEPV